MKKVLRTFASKLSVFLDRWGEDYNMTDVRSMFGFGRYTAANDLTDGLFV